MFPWSVPWMVNTCLTSLIKPNLSLSPFRVITWSRVVSTCSKHLSHLPFWVTPAMFTQPLHWLEQTLDIRLGTSPMHLWLVRDCRQLQRFLGFANFYHHFIWDFSLILPLTQLTSPKVPFQWCHSVKAAFKLLKKSFVAVSLLQNRTTTSSPWRSWNTGSRGPRTRS